MLVSGPRKVNKQGGGREGYAVAAEVLDDDWQDEYEDLAHEDEDEGEAFDHEVFLSQTWVGLWVDGIKLL